MSGILPEHRTEAEEEGVSENRVSALPAAESFSRPFIGFGDVLLFGFRAIKEIPVAVAKYPEECIRQTALIIRSNAVVTFFMMLMLGAMLGLAGVFVFGSVGLESFVGAIFGGPGQRGPIEMVFAWVFAAKTGCGIVSELGAMRISEEIDATEVMGIRSLPYLVSTRLVAAVVTLPLMFLAGFYLFFLGGKVFSVTILQAVSAGGYDNINYLMQSPQSMLICTVWSTILGVLVAIVSCYFGYNAKGGPVGVGYGTAQAMLVNLVMISTVSVALSQFFYGGVFDLAIGT